jgi:hypothetical protein
MQDASDGSRDASAEEPKAETGSEKPEANNEAQTKSSESGVPAEPIPRVPEARRALDAASRTSLVMLAVVIGTAFVAWGTAHSACNRRPARYKEPYAQELERLTRTPKDTAIEFHRRIMLADFDAAKGLAVESAVTLVDEKRAACDPNCSAATDLLAKGDLLATRGPISEIRVYTFSENTETRHLVRVERRDGKWKVVKSDPDDGTTPVIEAEAVDAGAPEEASGAGGAASDQRGAGGTAGAGQAGGPSAKSPKPSESSAPSAGSASK